VTDDQSAAVTTHTDVFLRGRRRAGRQISALSAVLVGGFLGGVARYLLDSAFPAPVPQFPWTILAINLAGSLLLALLLVVALEVWSARPLVRPMWATGFLGAFTTFSTYVVAVVRLAQADAWATALGYAIASIVGGLAVAAFGFWLGRSALSHARRNRRHDHEGY
jgi:CrcB protein